jgi:hypothetical protein
MGNRADLQNRWSEAVLDSITRVIGLGKFLVRWAIACNPPWCRVQSICTPLEHFRLFHHEQFEVVRLGGNVGGSRRRFEKRGGVAGYFSGVSSDQ